MSHICTLILFLFLCTLCDKVISMEKLEIKKNKKANDTITRTIRISGTFFDKITELAEKNGLSFNSVVNQIIEYGLENIQE